MASFFKRLNQLIAPPKAEGGPYSIFWRGAFLGVAFLSLGVMVLSGLFFRTGLPLWLMATATLIIGVVSFWFLRILGILLHSWISKVPPFIFSLFFGAIGTIMVARFIRFGFPTEVFYTGLVIAIVSFTFLFGSSIVLYKKATNKKALHFGILIIATTIICTSVYFLSYEGDDPYVVSFDQTKTTLLSEKGLENPGQKGNYKFQYFTYGSGTDKQREDFNDKVKYKTATVDASRLLPEWKGSKAKWRERYWGFGVKSFPLNGRVWMPEGEGKFPIMLMVHGNHGMEEHSDPGYAYLGELLSSRGIIMVSVDENFINGTWSGDFRGKEMPTRGWLLLKHLEQWKAWSSDASHELYGKADLNNVILAGHSRGGEAAPIAAHFNKLPYFPDDANEKFDFNFGIKGVLAIAPTDKRYERRIKLENINYLSIQGSYDSDEASFFGFRQYQRISFNDSLFYFKSGLYVHGANHGQFNSVWGKYDGGAPGKWLLNTAPMMTLEEQQEIAKVYISAFAESVLHHKRGYNDLFKNAACASDWLPDKILVNTYKDSKTRTLVNFEEDINLITSITPNSLISSEGLKLWREETLKFRDKDTQANNVVIVGWEEDSTANTPSYQISFSPSIEFDSSSSLFLSMAVGDINQLQNKADNKKEQDERDMGIELNFQIQLIDSLGNEANINISDFKKLTPMLKVQYVKLNGLNQDNFGDPWEPTLETFELPLNRFKNSGSLSGIKTTKFNFIRSKKGVLILDEIGIKPN